MKKIIFLIVITLSYVNILSQDLSQKPKALEEKEFKFHEFNTFNMTSGLKIITIEDHEQPTFTIRLLMPGGKSVDTLKPGTAEITAELLTKGCKGYNADELAEALDGLGLNLTANAQLDYNTVEASGLMKHFDKLLDIFMKILLTPEFQKDELEKAKKQMLSILQYQKGDPITLASKLASKVIYGYNHPYAIYPTTNSINSIELKDIKNYFEKYYIPNQATLAIIGDFKTDDLIIKIRDAFKKWKKGEEIEIKLPPIEPMPKGVYFIERNGSVQSSIQIIYKAIPIGNKNFDKLTLATSVISGGIAGRLFRVLREQYSYTYTPYGNLSSNKYFGKYYCGADVKKEVTDSAINVIFQLINSLSLTPPDDNELNLVKNYEAGTYNMNFENSSFIAEMIQNALFYNLSAQYFEQLPQRIMALNKYDVKDAASQFLLPKQAYIIVIGDNEVKSKLTQYGKLYEFNMDIEPITGEYAKLEKISLDAEELIEKYTDAIGGNDKINSIQTIIDSSKTILNNNNNVQEGIFIQYQKIPNKKLMVLDMGIFKQQTIIDGNNVWVNLDNKLQKLDDKESNKALEDAYTFKIVNLLKNNFKCHVLGKQNNSILMKVISPYGNEATYYFNANNYLLDKIERIEFVNGGTIPITETYKEYKEYDGIKMPYIIETSSPMYIITTYHNYKFNQPLEDSIFTPQN